ncbi:MAG: HAD-IIIA family hydrolase [Bdellovibrio sp.]
MSSAWNDWLLSDLKESWKLGGRCSYSLAEPQVSHFDWVFVEDPSLEDLKLEARSSFRTIVVSEKFHQRMGRLAEGLFDFFLPETQWNWVLSKILSSPSYRRSKQRAQAPQESRNSTESRNSKSRALFLDRDGVLIKDTGYVCRAQDVQLLPDVLDRIREAHVLNIPVIVVTNQSGLGRGYFKWRQWLEVQAKMLKLLDEQGCRVDDVFVSPFHASSVLPIYRQQAYLRKPRPGMLVAAAHKHHLDLSKSELIGDHPRDILAGKRAGVGKLTLLKSSDKFE